MINLPSKTKQWSQANNSDLFGNISITKNITFDLEGYLRLSNSPRAVMDENITADFDNPAVILYRSGGYFTATWDSCFDINENILAVRPTGVEFAPTSSGLSDSVFFGGLMPLTLSNDLYYHIPPVANNWINTNITLTDTSQAQHPLVNFISLSALAVADVNTVKTYSSPLTATPTLLNTLTILSDFYITGMCYFNQNLYIATMNRYGGHAFMYVWNGSGTAAQSAYEVDSNMIFSICVYQDSVAIITANGSLLRFNGSGFDLLDAFPIFYTDRALTDESNIEMYKNVMKSNGDLIYILFNDSSNYGARMLNQPDGIWCYDPKVGLHHRYSLSNSLVSIQTINTSKVDTATGQITVASPSLVTGTEIYYRAIGGTVIGGLTDETKYFAIYVDSTHIKLATTKANAIAGTAITLTGTGNLFQTIVAFPNIDYGQFFTKRTMALAVIERPVTNSQYGTDLIWGGEVPQRNLSTNAEGMLGSVSGAVEARGYFITPKIFSESVTDVFNQVTLKFSKFTSELDKIILKYRTTDDRRETININNSGWRATWTSTTTFETTQPDFINAKVGDEIEILEGAGAGLLAHIVTIVGTSTFTVTIDEPYDNYISGDVSIVIFRNWIKFATIDNTNTDNFLSQQLGVTGKFIQLKIELRGLGVRVESLSIDNKYQLPSGN